MKADDKLRTIKDMIKKHEGWRSKPYNDTEGILTIGYGFNIAQGITREEGEALLDIRLKKVFTDAILLDEFIYLDEIRQIVIIDMIYNMGLRGVKKFKNMRKAIKDGDWDRAADEMLDSRWARQVGKRATKLAKIMKEGKL